MAPPAVIANDDSAILALHCRSLLLVLLCPFYAVTLFTECGFDGVLKAGDVVNVKSPNYPTDPYPHNAECIWHFKSLVNAVELSTEFFNVEHYEPNICPDKLTLQVNNDEHVIEPCFEIPKLTTFGAHPPFNFTVTFRSDDHIHWMGFNLSFRAYDAGPFVNSNCGRRHRLKKPTTKFTLVSPNWPLEPAKHSTCSWTIENPLDESNYWVKMEFVHMDYDAIKNLKITDNGKPVKISTDCSRDFQRIRYFRSSSLSVDYEAHGNSPDQRIMIIVSAAKNLPCKANEVKCPGSNRCVPVASLCLSRKVCDFGSDQKLSICKSLETCGEQTVKPNIDFVMLGTNKAKPGSWPWMAMLFKQGYPSYAATIISPRWLLTSADIFCYSEETSYVAAIGFNDLQVPQSEWTIWLNVSRVIVHPKFHLGEVDYNIAMVMLDKEIPMPFNNRVNTVCLPEPNFPYRTDHWTNCITTTWGWRHPLMTQFQASILEQWMCRLIPEYDDDISVNVMCAKFWDEDARFSAKVKRVVEQKKMEHVLYWQGRGGGPLVCMDDEEDSKWTIYGVVPRAQHFTHSGVFQQTRVRKKLQFIWQMMLDFEAVNSTR
ncbi:Trypsin and CUB domain containing protein [Trichuris trichiura]|uniref:Trypsin and CUB domain containing protein n=1 Tax=Trichuris trichiura TaxID=36087 RepID=A0A077Z376_TRITR|nr:Trypsin and CUB domain containing protein [Trichuris trichiura]